MSRVHDVCVVALKTRVNVLMCVDRLLDCLDKMAIIDDVLPFLADIQTSEVDVIMSLVGQCIIHSLFRCRRDTRDLHQTRCSI